MKRLRPSFNLFVPVALLGAALLLWGSCGRGGNGDDDDDDDDRDIGVVNPEIRDVTGKFYYGSTDRPAAGSELWVLNHSNGKPSVFELSSSGSFKVPLKFFTEDEVYSFHLVKDRQLIGDVDLSPLNDGVQTAFTYRGGYGFDMGTVIVPLDRRGTIDLTAGGLQGKAGGGFSLLTDVEANFATFPAPAFLSTVAFGSHLIVTDASVVLNSFYNRADHPLEYGKDLASWSRVGVLVVSKEDDALERVFVDPAGSWLAAARLSSPFESLPTSAPLWTDTDHELVAYDSKVWRASVFLGALPDPQLLITVRANPKAGDQAYVPRTLGTVLTMPPMVVAANSSGGATAVVDYQSPTARNGLTRAFCQKGQVTLELTPPLDASGQPVPATTLDRIDVEFDYYKAVGGQAPRLNPSVTAWASPFNRSHETQMDDLKRTWNPRRVRLRYEVGETAGAAATQVIQIDPKLFPVKIGSDTVGKIRLRIYYRSETEATEGGTVVWFDKNC